MSVGGPHQATILAGLRKVPDLESVSGARAAKALPRALEDLQPDLTVLSLDRIPDGGLTLLHRLRDPGRHFSDLVIVTERPKASVVRNAARFGVLGCLVPPFDADSVSECAVGWRDRGRKLAGLPPDAVLSRRVVNELLPAVHARRTRSRPASGSTRDQVSTVLRQHDHTMSVPDIAERCGLSTVAAGRYLRQLVNHGEATMSVRHGRIGRPSHHYRWVGDR
ncbi:helix-turn-helix domain-containing protein [Amycolatopsis sp. EV170708-02-1]|uniref:helix-turn-helix domain-containing protein n=1 Tax=Amycolatopsis sp. EV170708-02-1 TaxID=2919322 RepID=UPI001F0BD39D|nr:helix-turn-helix domain-containing protein [Amycolatopsis sp. EV170708-02-1]UMO99828.1 hypothetical protein MJQ72_25275 [Amycolatopsis sp. EV170708-02-1]